MDHHRHSWELVPNKLPKNLKKVTTQLHFAAQFLAATGHSFLEHQEDDSHRNLAWQQGLGLQSRPFRLDQEYILYLNYEFFQLELMDIASSAISIVTLDGKTQKTVKGELGGLFSSKSSDEEDVYVMPKQDDLPDHPLKNKGVFQKFPEEKLRTLRLFRDNANTILPQVNEQFEAASKMRIWPHHFDNGSLWIVEKDKNGAMTKTVGWGFSIPNDADEEHHFYINHWSKESLEYPDSLPGLPKGAYWSNENKLMAILPMRALQACENSKEQEQLAQTFFAKGIPASKTLVGA